MNPITDIREVIPKTEELMGLIADKELTSAHLQVYFNQRVDLYQLRETRQRSVAGLGERVGWKWLDSKLLRDTFFSCIYLEQYRAGYIFWKWLWYNNGVWKVERVKIETDIEKLDHFFLVNEH
jgi:hypothetical protein